MHMVYNRSFDIGREGFKKDLSEVGVRVPEKEMQVQKTLPKFQSTVFLPEIDYFDGSPTSFNGSFKSIVHSNKCDLF
jgi:hypothetical protein